MAEELHYASAADGNKRKYDDTASLTTPSFDGRRKPTGFSSPDSPAAFPASGIESAKQRAQEIASRLFNDAEAKRPKVDGGGFDSAPPVYSDQKPPATNVHVASTMPSFQNSYGHQGSSKMIDIPNGRVGVIIGKGGETIKYLQLQSGAKIQVTRDMDADPNSRTRTVELLGTSDQVTKAEQLIRELLAEAEAGASAVVSRRANGQAGSEQFSMKIPSNKVGLVIGKGGESIKNIQARSGARVQVIPLHPPPGDTSTERTVQIDGSAEQIEAAKQLVNEVISENRQRGSSMGGGYPQQGYQANAPTSWAPGPPQQQPGYGYAQPAPYPGQQYPGYPQQTGVDYNAQQPPQGAGYDYYNQAPQQQQQPPTSAGAPTDNSYYNYNQPPASGYPGHQGYSQDGYGGYQGYEQQQGYGNPNPGYAADTTKPPGDAQAPPPPQASPLGQQGYYTGQQGAAAHPGYATQPPAQGGYAGGYGGPPPPPPAAGYGATPTQPGAYPGYGAAPAYGQPPAYGGGGSYGDGAYSQAPVYPAADGNANAGAAAAPPAAAAQPNAAAAAPAPAPESK